MWRSSSQWLGGLLLLIAIVGTIGSRQSKIRPVFLVSSEASGKNFYNNFNINFIKILLIYFLSTRIIRCVINFKKGTKFNRIKKCFFQSNNYSIIPRAQNNIFSRKGSPSPENVVFELNSTNPVDV